MAMGRRAEQRQAQEEFWIAHTQWPRTAADRGGNASSGIPVGTGVTGGERAAEGEDGGHRWHDAGRERSHALDCATGYGRGLRGVSAATGRGIGDRNADTGAVGEAGPQAGEEGIERRLGESA